MENEVNVKFNLNEAQVLIQLLDIAVRAQGLNAAEAGVILSKKIQQEFQAAGGDASILSSTTYQATLQTFSLHDLKKNILKTLTFLI